MDRIRKSDACQEVIHQARDPAYSRSRQSRDLLFLARRGEKVVCGRIATIIDIPCGKYDTAERYEIMAIVSTSAGSHGNRNAESSKVRREIGWKEDLQEEHRIN